MNDLELKINDFLIPHRINAAVHVNHIAVIKATQHMQNGVGFPDVGEKLVSKPLSLTCSFDQSGDIHDVNSRRDNALRFAHVSENFQPFIRHVSGAQVRLDCAEREIGALGLSGAHAVEQS